MISRVRWPRARVFANPPDPGRERLGGQQVAGHLPRFPTELGQVGVFVAAVEPPEKIAPVDHVERQHPRCFEQRAHGEAGPFGQAHAPGRQPGVRVDDVGGDQRVLQVEHGQLAIGGEHRPAGALLPGQRSRAGRWRRGVAWRTRA